MRCREIGSFVRFQARSAPRGKGAAHAEAPREIASWPGEARRLFRSTGLLGTVTGSRTSALPRLQWPLLGQGGDRRATGSVLGARVQEPPSLWHLILKPLSSPSGVSLRSRLRRRAAPCSVALDRDSGTPIGGMAKCEACEAPARGLERRGSLPQGSASLSLCGA